jgi:hypothetical protein
MTKKQFKKLEDILWGMIVYAEDLEEKDIPKYVRIMAKHVKELLEEK